MVLSSGCVYGKRKRGVWRISIMSRHTENDGKTPDPHINESCYDAWAKIFAPRDRDVGAYFRKEISWEEYKERYTKYLESIQEEVNEFSKSALERDFEVLCQEESPEYCHRKIFVEYCKKICPDLEIRIR